MARLVNSAGDVLLTDLKIADRPWSRMRGLLGTSELTSQQGMWFRPANSIHTFFMNYAIDCIFMDSQLRVKALEKNVKPGRLIWPILGARSVIEMKSGAIEKWGLSVGDQLHVGS